MATLAEKLALAGNATFIGQIKMQILIESSTQLQAPRSTSSLTKAHKLISLANSIVQSPDSYATIFANGIAATSNLTSPVADATVASAVTAAFPVIAGVTAND